MPFGLRNTTQTFQRFMDRLFKQLPFVFCYLDDLIIASHTLEEHHEHLWQIFTILQENGLQINPASACSPPLWNSWAQGGPAWRLTAPAACAIH
jgi:hypothetical protein